MGTNGGYARFIGSSNAATTFGDRKDPWNHSLVPHHYSAPILAAAKARDSGKIDGKDLFEPSVVRCWRMREPQL